MTGRRLAIAAAALAVAAPLGGCGGGSDDGGPLAWKKAPQVFVPKTLPTDRVLLGTLHNTTGKTRRLVARDIKVRDASGRVLRSAGRFTGGYAHSLYGAFQQPAYISEVEAVRLGMLRNLIADADTPIFVAWRESGAVERPVSVFIGGTKLTVPAKTRPAE